MCNVGLYVIKNCEVMDNKFGTLQEMLMNSFEAFKKEPAIGYVDGPDMTYGDLKISVEQQIFRLAQKGIKPGETGGSGTFQL